MSAWGLVPLNCLTAGALRSCLHADEGRGVGETAQRCSPPRRRSSAGCLGGNAGAGAASVPSPGTESSSRVPQEDQAPRLVLLWDGAAAEPMGRAGGV